MAKLNTWTNPQTGEIRVYVNGLIGQGHGDKVWFAHQKTDCFGCDWDVIVHTITPSNMNRNLSDKASELIGSTMKECASVSFDEIVNRGKEG